MQKCLSRNIKRTLLTHSFGEKTNMPHAVVEVADCKMAGKNTKDITVKQCVYTVEKVQWNLWYKFEERFKRKI